MYFDNEFRIHRVYFNSFSDYLVACKYHLKTMKKKDHIRTKIDRKTKELVFYSINPNVRFY